MKVSASTNSTDGFAVSRKFNALDCRVRALWAKSGDGSGHSVLAHMLDVAAAAEVLLQHEPASTLDWASTQFGLEHEQVARWISAWVGLHDFGKSIPGFQAKWPEGRAQVLATGLGFARSVIDIKDHASVGAALLRSLCDQKMTTPVLLSGVLQAISAHHGYNYARREMQKPNPRAEGVGWTETRKLQFEAYWETVGTSEPATDKDLSTAAVEWLAGLTSVADWIASNQEWFSLGERDTTLHGHWQAAKRCAERALEGIGWPLFRKLLDGEASTTELLRSFLGDESGEARPLQLAADALLHDSCGPGLLLIEAPMGEGKTEAAFLAFLRWQAKNQHRGLYIALPTRATGNAMFDRTVKFLCAFPGEQGQDIQLVHAGASMDEGTQRLREIHGEGDEGITSSVWFGSHRRGLLSPYGVGTIDQALFAALNVKHHFVRLWGLTNRVVVLDEVHAYDMYTSGLIEALLRWLKELGCSVVVMSATLPVAKQRAFLEAWGVRGEDGPEVPYPRLLLAEGNGVRRAGFQAREMASIELCGQDEDLEAIAARAVACVCQGGCGAVIVNTVDRAQKLYQICKARLEPGVLRLFHARFPQDQRAAIEQDVVAIYGKGGKRPAKGLLIATQVAEQSLDLDFDFLITDLAPMDLVLQRAGRLHRHQRIRPRAHAKPRLYVSGLGREQLPDLRETKWEYVYAPYILGRTWAFLSQERELHFPEDIDRLVQVVYGKQELPEAVPEKVRRYLEEAAHGKHLARVQLERQLATNVVIDPRDEPQNAYLDKPRGHEDRNEPGIQNRTRLGDDAVIFVPVYAVAGGWCARPGEEVFVPGATVTEELARTLARRQMQTSRKDIVHFLLALETPESFMSHPLLRYLKPLVLTDGRRVAGSLSLVLDKELGLVFENVETAPMETGSRQEAVEIGERE